MSLCWPNKRYAPNSAMTFLFQIGCHRRRVGDTFRSAT